MLCHKCSKEAFFLWAYRHADSRGCIIIDKSTMVYHVDKDANIVCENCHPNSFKEFSFNLEEWRARERHRQSNRTTFKEE